VTRGIRYIDGQQYMLNGRYDSRERALCEAKEARQYWLKVRIIKVWEHDFMLYVHGRKN
jgi:hypothetical protein